MKKILATASGIAVLAWSFNIAFAQPNLIPTEIINPNDKLVATVTIPEHAVEVAPNIFDLGLAKDADGTVVQGYAILHPKNNDAKPDHAGGPKNNGGGGKGTSKCFAPLAKGAAWKTTEPYIFNASNSDGMNEAFVTSTLGKSINEWDNQVTFDIFGTGTATSSVLVADEFSPDGQNEVYFGSIENSGTIAMTITWGVFSGPPSGRELREWDMVIDDSDFSWGDASVDSSLMDLENILVHELGHALGLGHPDDTCIDESMYRFASEGETKKRDLNVGDIAGVNDLY
ncbi:MAG: peptidase M10A and M12B matrixin and adamalysin [Candidatus Buchananbacteria bacterium CG10_big_fil_rev_8_21_14_0_10_42_9]|uniref:Peptidase M10A and M12B matrixin and adamalysin n=1 Tax=Candidatus Buchananbacteria bacterium CG10_big_fil_rev_8_21_14_0_10_42_9 TaxID=1974526 RepID=A0A2H0W2F6_9BACT|nr:MAG: peptidase M10A and M12B matrixin and adamalysin [Candidatus Buchananbacteria bacterium CG10_big_fil_rev_8_21_14_0_10_42_9]